MIEVHHLVKKFGNKAVLNDLNFQARNGEFVALLGPNGAGKTTFLRILASLMRPNFGEVRIANCHLPDQSRAARQNIGFVSHQPLLYGDLTAVENLRFYGQIYQVSNLVQKMDDVLSLVGLQQWRHQPVRTFSRGMQQRLSIARAVLHNPDVLLFDEPYTGLDQDACTMLDQILGNVSAQGRTIILASHDFTRIIDLATRFDVLSLGSIRSSCPSDQLPGGSVLEFYRQALL
jgi:heme exporter protein A